jgi:hypothetical protein
VQQKQSGQLTAGLTRNTLNMAIRTNPVFSVLQSKVSATPVQSTANDTGSGAVATSVTLTLGASTTVGNTLVLVGCNTSIGLVEPTVTGQASGMIWQLLNQRSWQNTGGFNFAVWIGRIYQTGTAYQVQRGDVAAFTGAFVLAEFPGQSLTVDDYNIANSATATTSPIASSTTAGFNSLTAELFVGGVANAAQNFAGQSTEFSAPSNSYSIIAQRNTTRNSGSVDCAVCMIAKTSTTGANTACTLTSANSKRYAGGIGGLRENLSGDSIFS